MGENDEVVGDDGGEKDFETEYLEAALFAAKDTTEIRPLIQGGKIGPFKILEKIGEGGMGLVFLAAQEKPLKRKVALKVIKLGMDTKEVIARFEAERQILALLDHPGIAKIFEAGFTEKGRPYFAMEYVEGQSITRYCDDKRLSIEGRIKLFSKACQAIQHAHQNAIIHRDIKPNNILVTEIDDAPVIKVIDFGISKALNQNLTDLTILTEIGRVVGTPNYMSPEQAMVKGLPVDTRTDVYSMGVVLYELLGGLLPYDSDEFLETIQRCAGVGGGDNSLTPPLLSKQLSSESSAEFKRANLREKTLGALISRVKGDLDWILLKALAADRKNRYRTMAEFDDDLQRHLAGKMIEAGPPSAAVMLKKFILRNKRKVIAGIFAAFCGLSFGVSYYLFEQSKVAEISARIQSDYNALPRLEKYAEEELWPTGPETLKKMQLWKVKVEKILGHLHEYKRLLTHPVSGETKTQRAKQKQIGLDRYQAYQYQKRCLATLLAFQRSSGGQSGANDLFGPTELGDQIKACQKEMDVLKGNVPKPDLPLDVNKSKLTHNAPGIQQVALLSLVGSLKRLQMNDPQESALATVNERLRFAIRFKEDSIAGVEPARLWNRAIAQIEKSPLYNHLKITKQLGLLPLGQNPDTGLWEFWHLETGDQPLQRKATKLNQSSYAITAKTGLVFVLIPGRQGKSHWSNDEKTVPLDPFYLSKYEMTQAQWCRFAKRWHHNNRFYANPSFFKRHTGDSPVPKSEMGRQWEVHPVEHVNHADVVNLLHRLGLLLPTRAQWVHALTCGGALEYTAQKYSGNRKGKFGPVDKFPLHSPVGLFPPSPWGLHDLDGNVSEWCRDVYASQEENDKALLGPGDGLRILRKDLTGKVYCGLNFNSSDSAHPAELMGGTGPGSSLGLRPLIEVIKAP